MIFAFAYGRGELAKALRTAAIDVTPLVTDVIDLADVPAAFRALERPARNARR